MPRRYRATDSYGTILDLNKGRHGDWVGMSKFSRNETADYNPEWDNYERSDERDEEYRDRAQKLWDEGHKTYAKENKGSVVDRLCRKFDTMSYRELQKIAKEKGIRANQKKEELCLALGSNVEVQGKHTSNALHELHNAIKQGKKKKIAKVIYANSDMPRDMVDLIASYASSNGK
jgi:predicted NACHT family NTPase